jgi:hypothetical protein
VEFLLTPAAIRYQARVIFERTEKGKGLFQYHPEQLEPTIATVLSVTRKNYPDLHIPFHSRWGQFRAGGVNRVAALDQALAGLDPLSRARAKLDLVIPSVLLDAGAGPVWRYREGKQIYVRSEGLGVASFHMFLAGAMSGDGKSPRVDAEGLARFRMADLMDHFQAGDRNPLVGIDGRLALLKNLGLALANAEIFGDGRPGNILDFLIRRCGSSIPASAILKAVLEGLGSIWPGRLRCRGVNLGDVWRHSTLDSTSIAQSLVPLHKLSQWMTYSLIEPIVEAGIPVIGLEELTGLAEYRNGGLFLDSGLLSPRDPADASRDWRPDSDFVIEWRALTVHLLDSVAEGMRKALGKTPEEFPLAKVLEGGTWAAGRMLANEKREGGTPPLNIVSDGTVF